MSDLHRAAFKEEAYELLADLETALMELEAAPEDPELVAQVFRTMHTLKGSGAMFGFETVASFTHQVETVFDHVRNGKRKVDLELIQLTLRARDAVKELLDTDESPALTFLAELMELKKSFSAMADQAPGKTEKAKPLEATSGEQIYRIRFTPAPELFLGGTNPLLLLGELRALGDCHVIGDTSQIPLLEDLEPEHCYLRWEVVLTTESSLSAIEDVFMFVAEPDTLTIEAIAPAVRGMAGVPRLGDILLDRGDVAAALLETTLNHRPLVGEMLVREGVVPVARVDAALAEQAHLRARSEKKAATEQNSSIRVPSEKLDMLINLVGELVTVQARLTQSASRHRDPALTIISEDVERLTWALRDSALTIRMLPIGTLFTKFKRLVHDLAHQLDKSVDLVIEGADTDLDKMVIERLNDPLVHLIRNSMDHGLESAAQRVAQGKKPTGTLRLWAGHAGTSVVIKVHDDGKGLDPVAIKAKAVERGLITAGAEVSQAEALALIVQPGFSTAASITSVSGRGVGLDVVKRTLEALQGTMEIESEVGKGTTFTIKLPLTLAIIDGLLVKIGESSFVMPLVTVEECIELSEADIAHYQGRCVIHLREHLVPYIRLKDYFEIASSRPPIEQIVITHIGGHRIGLVVDAVVGEIQTVIKPLGRLYRDVVGLSGATILGDGDLALILDTNKLIHEVEKLQAES